MDLGGQGIPFGLRGPVLVDDLGMPRYWAFVLSSLEFDGLSPSTVDSRLSGVERLYAFLESRRPSVDLDSLISGQHFGRLSDALHGFFTMLRNESSRTGRGSPKTWRSAVQFTAELARRLAHSTSAVDRAEARELGLTFERFTHRLMVARRRRTQRPRGLPAGVIEDLYELTDPESKRNPFRTEALRHRNFVIVLLLLHQGLRRGEILNLAVDSVRDEFDLSARRQRFWMDVCANRYERADPRGAPPRLKNDFAVRQIPISEPLAVAVDNYVQNYRGRRRATYLFYSQNREALAVRSLGKMFQIITQHLSDGAKRDLWRRRRPIRVTPHDLRHTCAAVRLHQLVGDDDARLPLAIQQLQPFFGWSRDSEMPLLYARTYFEHRLASVWRANFDARVEFLRSVR